MSAAALATPRLKPGDIGHVDLTPESGFTNFEHRFLGKVLDATANHTEVAVIMLVLRETEGRRVDKNGKPVGSRNKVKASETLPSPFSRCISWAQFSQYAMCDEENIRQCLIRMRCKTLAPGEQPGSTGALLEREPVGQLFRYHCNKVVLEKLAGRRRKDWDAERREAERRAKEAKKPDTDKESAAPESRPAIIPRKFGGFNKEFTARTGFKSEATELPAAAKRIAFEVPAGNLIILPALKDDVVTIRVRSAPELVTPQENLGGATHDKNSLGVLRAMLNRALASKLGAVDDNALRQIAALVTEGLTADLAKRIQARKDKIRSWGLVIGIARDVASAAAANEDDAHLTCTPEELAEHQEWERRHNGRNVS